MAVWSSTLRATYANALFLFDRRASSSAWSTWRIGASFAAYTSGSLITRGSATIVVCGTETARYLPVRSKMLPRSAGMATVRTRWPSPSDDRCERSRACRSKRRTPMAVNASTVTSTMPSTARGWAAADAAGARLGRLVVRGRAGAGRGTGLP